MSLVSMAALAMAITLITLSWALVTGRPRRRSSMARLWSGGVWHDLSYKELKFHVSDCPYDQPTNTKDQP